MVRAKPKTAPLKFENHQLGNNIKYHSVICILASLLSSGCSGPDIATRLASSKLVEDGILAQEQAVQGETSISVRG